MTRRTQIQRTLPMLPRQQYCTYCTTRTRFIFVTHDTRHHVVSPFPTKRQACQLLASQGPRCRIWLCRGVCHWCCWVCPSFEAVACVTPVPSGSTILGYRACRWRRHQDELKILQRNKNDYITWLATK